MQLSQEEFLKYATARLNFIYQHDFDQPQDEQLTDAAMEKQALKLLGMGANLARSGARVGRAGYHAFKAGLSNGVRTAARSGWDAMRKAYARIRAPKPTLPALPAPATTQGKAVAEAGKNVSKQAPVQQTAATAAETPQTTQLAVRQQAVREANKTEAFNRATGVSKPTSAIEAAVVGPKTSLPAVRTPGSSELAVVENPNTVGLARAERGMRNVTPKRTGSSPATNPAKGKKIVDAEIVHDVPATGAVTDQAARTAAAKANIARSRAARAASKFKEKHVPVDKKVAQEAAKRNANAAGLGAAAENFKINPYLAGGALLGTAGVGFGLGRTSGYSSGQEDGYNAATQIYNPAFLNLIQRNAQMITNNSDVMNRLGNVFTANVTNL